MMNMELRLLAPRPLHYFRQTRAWYLFAIFGLFLTLTACASTPKTQPFKIGQIIEVSTGKSIEFDTLQPTLLTSDVIYIGEEHYTPSHIQAATKIIETLITAGRHPAVAMEMFSWDGQAALDKYTRDGSLDHEQFLKESKWEKNWGGEFSDYEPLVQVAKTHRLPLLALNLPRPLVRLVAKKGLEAALRDPAMDNWDLPPNIPLDDSEYKKVIFKPIQLCHPGMPDKAYEGFYQASIFRDEGMAKVITDYLQRMSSDNGPVVSYTGGGHVQYKVPIPKRVRRDGPSTLKDISIYLIALDPTRQEEIHEAISEGIADYIWLTELGPRGPQPRCG